MLVFVVTSLAFETADVLTVLSALWLILSANLLALTAGASAGSDLEGVLLALGFASGLAAVLPLAAALPATADFDGAATLAGVVFFGGFCHGCVHLPLTIYQSPIRST
ncbi:hypothetical protein ACFQAT_02680 [Undibacterium arcticum]|uniref:hypothetical protein n=1 Tax=Undibacterium arcticum TaxID=1762892 RepID=UPI003606DE0B